MELPVTAVTSNNHDEDEKKEETITVDNKDHQEQQQQQQADDASTTPTATTTTTTTTTSPHSNNNSSPSPPAPPLKDGSKFVNLTKDLNGALSLEDSLPTNVSKKDQLACLPDECLSGDPSKPLLYVDDHGEEFHYSLRPMFYSVIFILLVELLERFSFYGINYTQASFLTGVYNKHWNAHLSSVAASSYVSVSTAIAYTAPFAGALLADAILGEYWAILMGATCLYLPGLLLIALTTVPYLLSDVFDKNALRLGLLVMWPIGTGIVKSVVNVFGAKQHHPILQASLIESYYVNFYMCINIGALAGGIIVPLVAQHNITLAYFIPVGILSFGVALFALGTPRYVIAQPRHDFCATARNNPNKKNINLLKDATAEDDDSLGLDIIARVSALIVPFCIAYSQMATTFIVQGTVMKKAFGFIDAASMNNCDAVSVLLCGYLVGGKVYPYLAKRNIKIPTTYKFALGSALGAAAIGVALFVEYRIRHVYETTGRPVNIVWQSMAYVLIGAGEIFAVSAAYEVAFTAAPPQKKALASATNLFFVGGVPNFLCIGLYHICKPWFLNHRGDADIAELEDYAQAQVAKYFWVLLGISLFGVMINLLPPVRDWVASIEEKAAEKVRTPLTTPKQSPKLDKRRMARAKESGAAAAAAATAAGITPDEEAPLLRAKQHQDYLKYGSGPVLYKHGSMRAGPTLSQQKMKQRQQEKQAARYKKYLKSTHAPAVLHQYGRSSSIPSGGGVELRQQKEEQQQQQPHQPALIPPRPPPATT